MVPTGRTWEFPHKFVIVEEHTGYELLCNGNFVAYADTLAPLLKYLGKQLEGT